MASEDETRWATLMAASQRGDRRSYAQLLRELVPVLTRAVKRGWPMAQQAEVEDVVQETLISLHGARHTYSPGRPFLPWLMAIARHRVADAQRRSIRNARREVTIEGMDETLFGFATNTGYRSLYGEALRKAIARLPPRQRLAVGLVKLKELSLKEAATVTGMSVAALKVATHRAIRSLRTMLGGTNR